MAFVAFATAFVSAEAQTYAAPPAYAGAELTCPVDHFVGWTDHADGASSLSVPVSGSAQGAGIAVAGALALAVIGALTTGDVSTALAGGTDTLAFLFGDGGLTLAIPAALASLRKQRTTKIEEARAILDKAEQEERQLTDEEGTQYDALEAEAEALSADIARHERQAEREAELEERTELRTVETGDVETNDQPEARGAVPGAAPAARAGVDRARELRKANSVLRLFRGIATNQQDLVRSAQRQLAVDGYYGTEARTAAESRAAGDYYSTLVDADGAILLPTEVSESIDRIGERLGFAQRVCTTFTHVVGQIRVPGATGSIIASAIGEGGAIKSSMRAFQAIELNPQKWGIILPWTYEANAEAGVRILEDAEWAIALGFERAKDNAVVNGNGTAAFNGVDGILSANRNDVANYVLGAGQTSMDDFSADDAFMMRRNVPAVLRAQSGYGFHPDMEPVLRTLKDGNGQYIYAYNGDTEQATLGGRPVEYSEVFLSKDADGASKTFGVFGAWKMIKIAMGEGMTSETLDQAIIRNANDDGDINLATQDLRALKCRKFWDADTNFEEAFTKATTAAA